MHQERKYHSKTFEQLDRVRELIVNLGAPLPLSEDCMLSCSENFSRLCQDISIFLFGYPRVLVRSA